MSLEIDLQEDEILRYQNSVNDPSHPMSFGISDRAVFMAREQHFKVDSYYMHRIPIDEVHEVALSRERGFKFWFFGIFVTVVGVIFSVGIFMAARMLPERPPNLIAQAGAIGLVIVGLIMLFDSRWRLVLSIKANQVHKWKPSIFANRAEARALQEDFLTACRYFGIDTHRDAIVSPTEIKAFWKWFVGNSSRRDFSPESIRGRVQKLSDSIVVDWEQDGSENRLIFSANYKKDLFPIVEEILRYAPRVEGWTFVAFRPPLPVAREYIFDDWILNIDEIFFEPYSDGFYLAIVIYGNWERVETYDAYEAGISLVKDLLGEYEYVLHLGGLEFTELKEAQPDAVLIPIAELPEYFENFFIVSHVE